MAASVEPAAFGPFTLVPRERRLFKGGAEVSLGGRAMDLLIALTNDAGVVLDKQDLIARVWPEIHVEESNLRTHVAALRKALGEGKDGTRYIVNVAGRGYCFVAPVVRKDTPSRVMAPNNLPVRRTELIGRHRFVRNIVERLGTKRLITVVGPPGVGKTSVALAAAQELAPHYGDGVAWLELGPISDAKRVATALRDVLNLKTHGDDSPDALIALIKDKDLLLVLDNCEHVVEAVAELAASILGGVHNVDILATSREPVRVDGEQVFILPALDLPPEGGDLTVAAALEYSAVQLFARRAGEASNEFELAMSNLNDIDRICRRLDGLPLAIELVAAQITAFSVSDLAERLAERLLPLASGRRGGPARQRALGAALGWSYELLRADEQAAFRALGMFSGRFTIEDAARITGLGEHAVAKLVSELVLKSLVQSEPGDPQSHFRLLAATREFLIERLEQAGEYAQAAGRHAAHYRDYFKRAYDDFASKPRSKWLPKYGPQLDNLRSALDWCFSAQGDAALGVALTINAVPFWMHMSLLGECRERVRQALACPESMRSERQDLQLYAALGGVLLEYGGNDADDVLEKASALARKLQDTDYRLRTLSMLWYLRLENGQFGEALAIAKEFSSVAGTVTRPNDALVGDRMLAANFHILGDQEEALRYNERVLHHYSTAGRQSDIQRFTIDQRAQAVSLQSSILWLRGYPDQSMAMARSALDDVVEVGHAASICSVLVHSACPLALFNSDFAEAGRLSERVLQLSTDPGHEIWRAWARCLAAIVRFRTHRTTDAAIAIGAAIKDLSPWRAHPRNKILVSEYAQALGRVDRAVEGLAEITTTLDQCERAEERVLLAELLRVKAELLIAADVSQGENEARRILAHALSIARTQTALSLELRAALSLCRLYPNDRPALDTLLVVYNRFSEGWQTADLVLAKQMLGQS